MKAFIQFKNKQNADSMISVDIKHYHKPYKK